MRTVAAIAALAAAFALAANASADEKRDRIVAAVDAVVDSIVKVEFECPQTDGKGSQTFTVAGFVVSEEGLVMVTDVHQVDPPVGGQYQKPEGFTVHFDKEAKAKARFLGKDEDLNLALLKLTDEPPAEGEKAPEVKALALAPCERIGLAEEVLVVNRLGKEADFRPTFALMRVTAVIPKPAEPPEYRLDGNLRAWEGCPVLTLDGRVVACVALEPAEPASGGRTVTFGGRTFFVGGRGRRGSPRLLCTDDYREFLADPSKFLRRKSWLGVRGLQALSKPLAEQLGVETGGVILGEILEKSPAQKGGLQDGDIVVRIDDEPLEIEEQKDVETFTKRVERADGGTLFAFTVLRPDGQAWKETRLQVTVEEEPVREYEVEEWEDTTFGLRVKPLTRDFLDRGRLDLDTKGVRVTYVENAGYAALAGLQRDDIVQDVVLVKTPDMETFKKQIAEVAEAREVEVCFSVLRGGKNLYLCVRPDWALLEESD